MIPLANLLTRDALSQVIENVDKIKKLNDLLKGHLTDEFKQQIQVGDFNKGILTLLCHDANWLTQLRYQVPTLLSKLRAHSTWAGIISIQLKVKSHVPIQSPLPVSEPEPAVLQKTTTDYLKNLAQQLNETGCDSLSKSLLRLINQSLDKRAL